MGDLQNKFKNIMNDIEENIQNKEDLEYIKTQIYNISVLFLDELDKLADLNMNKINSLIERHKEVNEKIAKIEGTVRSIERDIYLDDAYDFEITCPYCNYEFIADFGNELKKEVTCPECNNIIELDWNEEENCDGNCSHCHHEDNDEEVEFDEVFEEDEEEDM